MDIYIIVTFIIKLVHENDWHENASFWNILYETKKEKSERALDVCHFVNVDFDPTERQLWSLVSSAFKGLFKFSYKTWQNEKIEDVGLEIKARANMTLDGRK